MESIRLAYMNGASTVKTIKLIMDYDLCTEQEARAIIKEWLGEHGFDICIS